MTYTEQPIPDGLHAWQVREAMRLREWFRDETDEVDGILRWKSNGRVVPGSSYRDAFCTPPEGSVETEARENQAFLDEYRRNPPSYDADTLDEMRREFGEGTTVVNVVTGHRTRL